VVCVSLQDAEAYAGWYSHQTGQRWRLPTAEEAHETPAQPAIARCHCGRAIAPRAAAPFRQWQSWRSTSPQRPLQANRGYDDVGFRLVRDL
jgi:formylglycine-generating enzyme required for sulfatase activity